MYTAFNKKSAESLDPIISQISEVELSLIEIRERFEIIKLLKPLLSILPLFLLIPSGCRNRVEPTIKPPTHSQMYGIKLQLSMYAFLCEAVDNSYDKSPYLTLNKPIDKIVIDSNNLYNTSLEFFTITNLQDEPRVKRLYKGPFGGYSPGYRTEDYDANNPYRSGIRFNLPAEQPSDADLEKLFNCSVGTKKRILREGARGYSLTLDGEFNLQPSTQIVQPQKNRTYKYGIMANKDEPIQFGKTPEQVNIGVHYQDFSDPKHSSISSDGKTVSIDSTGYYLTP